MKIALFSDLHLEFSAYFNKLPEADVCVLAGDICVASSLFRKESKHGRVVRDFFQRVSDHYPHVVQIMGNHEYYNSHWENVPGDITRFLEEANVGLGENWHFLNNETVDIMEHRFIGTTLWSDFNKADRSSMQTAQFGLNDYRLIAVGGAPITPGFILNEHVKNVDFVEEQVAASPFPCVVVGHHAPSKKSTHPKYAAEHEMNGAYSSDLEWIMKVPEHDIKLWCHGHTHDNFDYFVDRTNVVCNPRGYEGWETNSGFKPQLVIKV